MRVALDTDAQRWAKAMRRWRRAKGNPAMADVVNHFAQEAVKQVFKETPQADLKMFPIRDVDEPKTPGQGTRVRRKKWTKKDRIFFALATKAGARKGQGEYQAGRKGLYGAAMQIYKKRRSGKGLMRAGWVKVMRDLGVPSARSGGVRLGKLTRKSYAKKARTGKLEAVTNNGVPGSEAVCEKPMLKAMRIVTWRERAWAERHMAKAAKQFPRAA